MATKRRDIIEITEELLDHKGDIQKLVTSINSLLMLKGYSCDEITEDINKLTGAVHLIQNVVDDYFRMRDFSFRGRDEAEALVLLALLKIAIQGNIDPLGPILLTYLSSLARVGSDDPDQFDADEWMDGIIQEYRAG